MDKKTRSVIAGLRRLEKTTETEHAISLLTEFSARVDELERLLQAGDTWRKLKKHGNDYDRFFARVQRGVFAECWPWLGPTNPAGYGRTVFRGRTEGAHRAAYELAKGPIPRGSVICHSCDNPICCNPSHLTAGSPLDNGRDAAERGRMRAGADHPKATLTWAQVNELRDTFKGERGELRQWARKLGISPSTVSGILSRKTWKGRGE